MILCRALSYEENTLDKSRLIILWWFSGALSFSWKLVIYLIIMTACLNIGARVQGKKMVYNVLSIDVNESVLEDRTKNDKQNI